MADKSGAAELVRRVLAGEAGAVRPLLGALMPVLRARAMRVLRRRRGGEGGARAPEQELEDMLQEVLGSLFENDARVLRAWKPELGLSLENFVGLVTEREVSSILRSGKRSPWKEEPTEGATIEAAMATSPDVEERLASREMFQVILERLREELSPRGLLLFEALVVEERPVTEVCEAFGMQPDAVYAWRSRLLRQTRAIAASLDVEHRVEVAS